MGGEGVVAFSGLFRYHQRMSFDPSTIQLPPPGAKLRLPPPNRRELSYEEKYLQVRRHLRDDEDGAMSVQMKAQVHAHETQPARLCQVA
jgi:hypothetical protein